MKGTLFSADFIKDSTGNLRLIELNTDTSIVQDKISSINLTDFIAALQANSVDTLEIIYKPFIHKKIVDHIQSTIASDASFITSVVLHDEDRNTIYPTAVTDASNKFILRLAYDESAILDSTYTKNRLNVFNLFNNGTDSSKVVAYYHSGSEGIKDTLVNELNTGVIPDAVIKDIDESFNPIDIFKIGSEVDGETAENRWDSFVNLHKAEDKLIEQYHYHSSSVDSDNKINAYRQVSIVYGTDLNVVNLVSYKAPATLDLPTDISGEFNTGSYSNKLADNHYYEYTTNYPTKGSAGILSTHEILTHPTGSSAIGDLQIGDSIKSYFISGSPDIESNLDSVTWSISGQSFPSGSYLTSSLVVYKESDWLKYGAMVEVKVDSESIFSGVNKQYLVYDSGSDTTKFKIAIELDPSTDYFFDENANLIDIDEANFYVTTDANLTFTELDVEDTDTYIISGSTAFQSIVSHNAPCFVAGTKITLANGDLKNIEEVAIDDEVLSYNFRTNSVEGQKVKGIGTKKVTQAVKYTFSDESTLIATLDHPLYCEKHQSWVSHNPEYTSLVYNLTTIQVGNGCIISKHDGSSNEIVNIEVINEDTVVHNLTTVAYNHNFYANEYLVHNRGCFIAGTQITLADGSVKNIEDVDAGDEVLTFYHEDNTTQPGVVGELKQHEVGSVVRITFDNDNVITATQEHPFYTKRDWVQAGKLEVNDVCYKADNSESIVTSVETINDVYVVYNLLSVGQNHNFYANGILVHNKL